MTDDKNVCNSCLGNVDDTCHVSRGTGMCKSCVEGIFADVVRQEVRDGNVVKVEHSMG